MPPRARSAPVVLSVGGSLLRRGDAEQDRAYLGGLADHLRQASRHAPLAVTTGGGSTAREYIDLGRALGLTEIELDEIGIEVTRLHARLLAARLGPPTPPQPPHSIREAVDALTHGGPVVLGGTEPGHTTDAVAALLAVRLRAARVVNATDVDGVYDRDPRRDPRARRLDRIDWPRFRAMIDRASTGAAGQHLPFDRLGAATLERAGIPLVVVDGNDLANLDRALAGRPCAGTRVGDTAHRGARPEL